MLLVDAVHRVRGHLRAHRGHRGDQRRGHRRRHRAGNPAHFNPAVSVAMLLRGKVSPGRCAAIVAAQVAAAAAAIAFVNWMKIRPTHPSS